MRPSTLKATPLVALLAAAGLTLSACAKAAETSVAPPVAKSAPAVVEPETWPFTGLEAKAGQEVALERPVVVVKIDNSGQARQAGLSKADLVFEQLVEGGTTRLAAFYHSKAPENVGPVRSMRATDIGIIAGTDAHIVTSGAASQTIARVRGAGIPFHEEGARGLLRDRTRYAPYNLMANLKELAAANPIEAERPDDYFEFGTAEDLPAGQPASGFSVNFGYHTSTWTSGAKSWKQTNTNAAEGDVFKPSTVLVLKVRVENAGYTDVSGSFVPESVFEGKGEAQLFHGGKVVAGTWRKRSLTSPLRLEADGRPLKVPAGKVFVELLPENGSVSVTP